MYGLRIQHSRLVNANIFLLFSALWLVDDRAAVSLRHVWTRDRMLSFLRIFSVSSSVVHPAVYPCHLMVVTCALMDISSHGPVKASSHFAVHMHVSPILTCRIVENPSEGVPRFPFFPPPPSLPPSLPPPLHHHDFITSHIEILWTDLVARLFPVAFVWKWINGQYAMEKQYKEKKWNPETNCACGGKKNVAYPVRRCDDYVKQSC